MNPDTFRKNVASKFAEKIDPVFASNMEKGIYNWTVSEANSRKIMKKWSNKSFVLIYTDRFRSIWFNLSMEIIDKINKTNPLHFFIFAPYSSHHPCYHVSYYHLSSIINI